MVIAGERHKEEDKEGQEEGQEEGPEEGPEEGQEHFKMPRRQKTAEENKYCRYDDYDMDRAIARVIDDNMSISSFKGDWCPKKNAL